jgi:hypothetical protein
MDVRWGGACIEVGRTRNGRGRSVFAIEDAATIARPTKPTSRVASPHESASSFHELVALLTDLFSISGMFWHKSNGGRLRCAQPRRSRAKRGCSLIAVASAQLSPGRNSARNCGDGREIGSLRIPESLKIAEVVDRRRAPRSDLPGRWRGISRSARSATPALGIQPAVYTVMGA